MSSDPEQGLTSEGLVRGLGRWDATLLTVGSVIGTGIFITTADIARVLPHEGMILLVWTLGGFLTLAGAPPMPSWERSIPAPAAFTII